MNHKYPLFSKVALPFFDFNLFYLQVLSIYSHPDKIIIRDKGAVEKVLERLIEDGPEALQVIADFDMTLTRYHQDGVKCQTCHGKLFVVVLSILYSLFTSHDQVSSICIEYNFVSLQEFWTTVR
jgi:hypothetical protein